MNSIGVILFVFTALLCVPLVEAEPIVKPTQPQPPTSKLIITAYQASVDGLDLIQIYNTSDKLISLEGMSLRYSNKVDTSVVAVVPLNGLIKPNSHILASATDVLAGSSLVAFRFAPSGWAPKTVWIESPLFAPVTMPSDAKIDGIIYKRSLTSTGYSTAASALNSPLAGGQIEGDLLYTPPISPKLQIVEVSPRAKTCPPFNSDVTCNDFIKLRMLPGFDIAAMSEYRVRTGSSESITNTFLLDRAHVTGEYLLLYQRDDGAPLSLTNSGGYVWLEDIFGVTRYQDTLVEYADAGSTAYVNQSWALDDQTLEWRWGIPSPFGPNTFPVIIPQPVAVPADCPAGKYRNPETNRCRTIEEAVNALAACDEGKERNPATNRCRSIITVASSSLVACKDGQERNPATNRCRSITSLAAALQPCVEGQERNPETNRCRKVSAAGANTLAAVTDIPSDMKHSNAQKWWIAGVVALFALGYAVYEWRQEVLLFGRLVVSRLRGK